MRLPFATLKFNNLLAVAISRRLIMRQMKTVRKRLSVMTFLNYHDSTAAKISQINIANSEAIFTNMPIALLFIDQVLSGVLPLMHITFPRYMLVSERAATLYSSNA
jgi:hypothetical protein